MPAQGTPRELGPVAERVLVWVAQERKKNERAHSYAYKTPDDDIRAIELCALATREAAMFFDLYGIGDPDAPAAQVQDERRAPGRLPEAEGCCRCDPCFCGDCRG